MRTNVAGFALTFALGLVVLLIGFLALSAGGLVQLGPVEEVAVEHAMPDESAIYGPVVQPAAYVPANPQEAAAIEAGDALFKNNRSQCHAINDKVVGPALAGITKRRTIGWIIPWVRNSAKVIASGDVYAVKLYDDNGKQQMPAFPQLSDTDIKNIVAYVSVQMGTTTSDGATVVAAR